MQLRNHRYLGILSPILTQEANSGDLIEKRMNRDRPNETRDYLEYFSNEFNLRLSLDSMIAMMHSQINRAISSAISDRVIPEIKNIMSSMSSEDLGPYILVN